MVTLNSRTIAESVHWSPKTTADSSTADSDKTFTVTTGSEWRPQLIRVKYTASTNSGNRQLEVQLRSTANTVLHSVVPKATQAANSTAFYNIGIEASDDEAYRDGNKLSVRLPSVLLGPSYDIRVFDNASVASTVDDMDVTVYTLTRNTPTT